MAAEWLAEVEAAHREDTEAEGLAFALYILARYSLMSPVQVIHPGLLLGMAAVGATLTDHPVGPVIFTLPYLVLYGYADRRELLNVKPSSRPLKTPGRLWSAYSNIVVPTALLMWLMWLILFALRTGRWIGLLLTIVAATYLVGLESWPGLRDWNDVWMRRRAEILTGREIDG